MFENKLVEDNSLPIKDRSSRISFVLEGQKSGHRAHTNMTGKWDKVRGLEWLVGRQLQVPQCVVVNAARPDMVSVNALFTLF